MSVIETPWPERVLVIRNDVIPSVSEGPVWAGHQALASRRTHPGPSLTLGMTQEELTIANSFKLASRREEWLLSRTVAKQLAMQLGIASDPRAIRIERPFLVVADERTNWRVSLSHSAPYAGAATARVPIGIDVQVLRDLDERAAHLFLTDEETARMRSCTIPHRILHFWCAKEAAWKTCSDTFATLRQMPLTFLEECASGMRFDAAETTVVGDLLVSVTRSTV